MYCRTRRVSSSNLQKERFFQIQAKSLVRPDKKKDLSLDNQFLLYFFPFQVSEVSFLIVEELFIFRSDKSFLLSKSEAQD